LLTPDVPEVDLPTVRLSAADRLVKVHAVAVKKLSLPKFFGTPERYTRTWYGRRGNLEFIDSKGDTSGKVRYDM